MKISTRGRYGLRALIDLSLHSKGNRVSLADISERQDLSLNYLESIFAILKRSGMVVGCAGAQGGYILAKPAKEINLLEVLTALEGDLSVTESSDVEETPIRSFLKKAVWDVIDCNVNSALSSATLADVVAELDRRASSVASAEL